jgi:hypothetical protein
MREQKRNIRSRPAIDAAQKQVIRDRKLRIRLFTVIIIIRSACKIGDYITESEFNNCKIQTGVTMKKRKKLKWTLFIVIAAVAACILVIAAYSKGMYRNRWYQNTKINGIDVSGMSLSESVKAIKKQMGSYELTVKGRDGGSLTIQGDTISYRLSFDESVQKLFAQQHGQLTLPGGMLDYTYNAVGKPSYSKAKVRQMIGKSELLNGSSSYQIQKPKSASIVYSSSKKQMVIQKEEEGNTLIRSELTRAVFQALEDVDTSIDLSNSSKYPDVYKKPELTSKDKTLTGRLTEYNEAALRFVTWDMGENTTEELTPEEISKWLVWKDGAVTYDTQAMRDWVEKLCLKYKTVGKTRKIKSHTGKTVTVSGGDYGWQMDYEKTVEQVKNVLDKEADSDAVEAYLKDPSDSTEEALTTACKVQYANTAYQKDYVNGTNDWDQNNYTEIDLSAQMVYVFRNGKVSYSCRTISGKPVTGRTTPTGAYYIKEHQMNRTLVGEDYKTPVQYWVRITWTGTGFHAAPWQSWSSWSASYYKTRGSHGCLNLSNTDAARIYNLVKYREAVFIHY